MLSNSLTRHPITGIIVFAPLASYAIYQGFAGRRQKDAKRKRLHASLMPWVTGATFVLALDGHCSLKTWDEQKVGSSVHALTGGILLIALIVQSIGSKFLDHSERSRDIHTYLGGGITILLTIHCITGVGLYLDL